MQVAFQRSKNSHYLKASSSVGGHPTENTQGLQNCCIPKSPIWLKTQTALTTQPTDIFTAALAFLLIGMLMGLMFNIMGSSDHSLAAHSEVRTFTHWPLFPQACQREGLSRVMSMFPNK